MTEIRRALLAPLLLLPSFALGGPITLDGAFDDWAAAVPAASDALGDFGASGIDFDRVWFDNDARYVYLRFQTGAEVQGDEGQSLRLYLDIDMNAATGTSFDGIGADLVWDFGQRNGNFRGSTVYHDDLGMLLGPTVSNTEFEIAFLRDVQPAGGIALFPGDQVRWILRDLSAGGDRVPNAGAQTSTIREAASDDPSIPLPRFDEDHVRVVAFNVLQNGLFEGGSREAAYVRALDALDADVWVFNEVWDYGATETRDRVEELHPAGPGQSWYAVKRDSGNVIVSRFPIVASWEVFPGARLTAVHLDLDGRSDRDLLVVAAHLSCCSADDNRQDQADALVAFLRDARTTGGVIDLPDVTPMVAAGDFNLVGLRRQLDTIVTGDIVDEGRFGPDAAPDWDGGDFDLAPSIHNDRRVAYTWRNDNSSFLPGVLDFVFYTGSTVELGNHFVFDTRTMSTNTLTAAGLLASDSNVLSDHNPRVLDLDLATSTDAPPLRAILALDARPNPFNPRTSLHFHLPAAQTVTLAIHDVSGRLVRTVVSGTLASGHHTVEWDGRDDIGRGVASGSYRARLVTRDGTVSAGVTLIK